jgi:excisionase family DNA binding protein
MGEGNANEIPATGQERVAWSLKEVHQKLGISQSMLFELLAQGKIGSIKVGRRRLITKAHLDAFLSQTSADGYTLRIHSRPGAGLLTQVVELPGFEVSCRDMDELREVLPGALSRQLSWPAYRGQLKLDYEQGSVTELRVQVHAA